MQIRIQKLFHDGLLVADYVAMPKTSGITTEAGSSWSVSFEYGPTNELKGAVIGTKDGVILEAFTCTNGVLFPAEKSVIQKGNALGGDVKSLLSEVEELMKKHKDK